jgi:hypothetical protein
VHFLHRTVYAERRGNRIGAWVIHCANGETYEQPIRYEVELSGWWGPRGTVNEATDSAPPTAPTLVWQDQNPANKRYATWLRIYKTTWDNPQPDVEIESIDFHSDQTACAPFLVAITLETPDSPGFWMTEAQKVREKGDVAGALVVLDQAAQRLPASPKLWIARGKLLESASQTNEALEAFSRAIELAVADTNAFGKVLTAARARLDRSALLKRLNRLDEAAADNLAAYGVPPRHLQPRPEWVNLDLFFNGDLTTRMGIPPDSRAAATMAADVRRMTGLDFDLRGVVRLAGTNWVQQGRTPAPEAVTGIPLGRRITRLHVLHGTDRYEPDGTMIGNYVFRYADGRSEKMANLRDSPLSRQFLR